jgi:hypothetical protein
VIALILTAHFAYVAYVVVGGFLAWRWPRAIWPHLLACAWAALIVLGWVDCPLTWAEDWARHRAGQGHLTQGFVDRYLTNVIYPARYLGLARLVVAVVIATSWVGAYVFARRRARRRVASGPDTTRHGG